MPAPLPHSITAAPSLADPIPIERAEILAFDGHFFARVSSGDWHGSVALGRWTPALISLWQTRVLPFWLNRDARAVAADVAAIAQVNDNYKLASAPFWMAVAGVELAIWDLLGQARGRGVSALACEKPRRKLPVYLSSLRRDTSARAEIEWLSEAVAKTGARAAKIKIGARLRWGAETEARDHELLNLARQKWGDKFTLYADANGSFGADKAIEVGEWLHAHKVAWFEEPCDWEDFEATRAVAARVQLPVAGGAQESSWPRWKWSLENCAFDIAQPDIFANGGWTRSLQVAQFAAGLNVTTTPHSPRSGPQSLPALHLAAAIEKPAPFLEWDARLPTSPAWFEGKLDLNKGAVNLPSGAGWGAVYDDAIWKRAETLAAASV